MGEWQPARLIALDLVDQANHLITTQDYEAAKTLLPKVFRVKPYGRPCACGAPRLAIHPEDLPGPDPSVCSSAVLMD